ncbi:hypothetical protein Tco_1325870, partial [Tanacetum coccineum]
IEDWVSDDKEEVEPVPKVEKKTAIPTATKKESVKPEKQIRRPIRPVNTVRSVNTGRPFSTARPFYKRTALTKRTYYQRFTTGRQNVNTVKARGFNASNSQLNDNGFVDSGCSRHMTGNIAHLSDFKDFDGGYVTFGGGAYGGKITGKGTIKTDNLDFDDVYFVKELKFNRFTFLNNC